MPPKVPFMKIRLVAELEDGKTIELLSISADKDGNVEQLDESTVDTLLKTPSSAKLWGTAFTSIGGMLLDLFHAFDRGTCHA